MKKSLVVSLFVFLVIALSATAWAQNTNPTRHGYNQISAAGKAVGSPGGEIIVPQVWFSWGAWGGKIIVDSYCENCLSGYIVEVYKNQVLQSTIIPQKTTVEGPDAETINQARGRVYITSVGLNEITVRIYIAKNMKQYFEYSIQIYAPIFEIWLNSVSQQNGLVQITYAIEQLFADLTAGDEIDLQIDGVNYGRSTVTKNPWGQLGVSYLIPIINYIIGERETTATVVRTGDTTEKFIYYWPLPQ